MKTVTILSTAIALAVSLSFIGVQARHGHPPLDRLFDDYDLNGDEILTQDEVQASRNQFFSEADSNGDGYLSVDELVAAHEAKRQQHRTERFYEIDTNGDGVLNLEEFLAAKPPHLQNDEKPATHPALQRLDTDGDGQISQAEFTSNLPFFDRLDSDADGIINKSDLLQDSAMGTQGGRRGVMR